MPLSKTQTTRKAGYVTGYVALAVIVAEYVPWIKDLPKELTIPLLSGIINALKNIIKHRLKFDPFNGN